MNLLIANWGLYLLYVFPPIFCTILPEGLNRQKKKKKTWPYIKQNFTHLQQPTQKTSPCRKPDPSPWHQLRNLNRNFCNTALNSRDLTINGFFNFCPSFQLLSTKESPMCSPKPNAWDAPPLISIRNALPAFGPLPKHK
jgi:hypothetical protein